MFCINVSFFISIISFFLSFISFDNTQKTIYRTVKKKTLFHSPSLAVYVSADSRSVNRVELWMVRWQSEDLVAVQAN